MIVIFIHFNHFERVIITLHFAEDYASLLLLISE